MKKEQKIIPASKVEKKTGPGSDPVNKFKKEKTTTAAAIDNIITGAVENVKSRPGRGLADEVTVVFYDEEH